jgi:translation elongation factor EF-Tu-like GTPase
MSMGETPPAAPRIDVWILGHPGHGKKTLKSALERCESGAGASASGRFATFDEAPVRPRTASAAVLVVSAAEGPMPQTRDQLAAARQAGVPRVVVFLNKIDSAPDKDLASLIEMEVRELMTLCGFAGEKAVFVRGSAKLALEGDASGIGAPSMRRLLDAVAGVPTEVPGETRERGGGFGGLVRRLFSP